MKTHHLLLLAASLLLAGCATSPDASSRHHPPLEAATPAAGLLVISATYGSGTNFLDVTARVDDLLRQPDVVFAAHPKWLGVDPTPGWNKALVIVYEYRGRRHIFTRGEGGEVSVSALLAEAGK